MLDLRVWLIDLLAEIRNAVLLKSATGLRPNFQQLAERPAAMDVFSMHCAAWGDRARSPQSLMKKATVEGLWATRFAEGGTSGIRKRRTGVERMPDDLRRLALKRGKKGGGEKNYPPWSASLLPLTRFLSSSLDKLDIPAKVRPIALSELVL